MFVLTFFGHVGERLKKERKLRLISKRMTSLTENKYCQISHEVKASGQHLCFN